MPKTKIASHRGGSDLWPENSLTAFRNTALLPVEQVEFDVHQTRDEQLVVHHDATLERMTDGQGPIAGRSFEELSAYTIKGTENDRIPSLSDVLTLFAATKLGMRLEIKSDSEMRPYPGLEAKIAAALVAHGMLERTVVTSFLIGILKAFHQVEPTTPRIWLVSRVVFRQVDGIDSVLEIAEQQGLHEIALHADDLTQRESSAAKSAGIRIGGFGVRDRTTIERMYELGVSAFTTDRPDLALRIRSESARDSDTRPALT